MAEYDNRVRSYNAAATTVVDEGLRAYMLQVYNYMLVGLALSGATAYLAAETPVRNVFFNITPYGASLNGLGWVALLAHRSCGVPRFPSVDRAHPLVLSERVVLRSLEHPRGTEERPLSSGHSKR